ncbi:hypothetical protein B0F90DRAFT_1925534 [Multifurca ochricompacta]|uniref:RING-type domain-containing protein n=1 Tax=Multifurca ochricompacta TaxID=376703 RepID=A0AAD4QMB9_9AGAM|nr:hypothetical protein B0F90DRAFT_1925534 [Multifurca ochricompacta]
MEQNTHGASLLNAFNHLFRRRQSPLENQQMDSVPEPAGAVHTQFNPFDSFQLDHGREMTSSPGSAASHAADEDVEMLLADPPIGTPYTSLHSPHFTPHSSRSPSLMPTTDNPTTFSPPIDSEVPQFPHLPVTDDEARSDTSMPPLFDASDSEYEEDYLHHGVYDSMSESEADARDVEMTLLFDDGDLSDNEDSPPSPPNEGVALPESAASMAAVEGNENPRHVTVEEIEDQDQQRIGATPLASSTQPGPSSYAGPHPHWHFYPHPHPHPHPHLHPHPHPQPYQHQHQHQHQSYPPHPHGGIHLPTFPGMPGLRAQGQGEGQVPLPGLRTLFQPLIIEGVAQAGERFRTAQGTGGSTAGQGMSTESITGQDGSRPGMSRTGVPVVQVTFDVPMFRVPAEGQRRQEYQADVPADANVQRQANQTFEAFAAPPLRTVNPDPPEITNLNLPTPNPIPPVTDAMPAPLRQLLETLDLNPDSVEIPTPSDGPQIGAGAGPVPGPAWTGLMGLLFGLGLGTLPELNREDPVRARRLVKGLETVTTGLVKRMRKISEGNADGAICAICWDSLSEEDVQVRVEPVAGVSPGHATPHGETTDMGSSITDPPEPEEPLPSIVALPCSHVFHGACLVPWFSRPRQTTCPTCRFNVDPDNLTYEPPPRSQTDHRQQPQRATPPQPVAPQQQASSSGSASPLQQASPQHHPPPLTRTIFEHTFTIPFPPPVFPFPHPQSVNLAPQPPQAELRQPDSVSQQGFFPAPSGVPDPLPPLIFQRIFHTLRHSNPSTQYRPQPPSNGVPIHEATPQLPLPGQPQVRPLLPAQGLQPPSQDGQRNVNGMPRFPGLFQFELPQIVRMPDGSWFWTAPLGGFPPSTTPTPQASQRPPAPKRTWAPPPPPGLTLRQRVEQGEREQGLRCDDVSCGLGPSDDDPEPTADLARVIIQPLGEGAPTCAHTFHPACLVSAERVAGWGPDDEREHERTERFVEVSCPMCRAVGAVLREDWEKGVQALV